MKRKVKVKNSKDLLSKKISTKVGILVIIIFALPLAIYANNAVLPTQQNDQQVEGVSYFTGSTYGSPISTNTTNSANWHCPPGAMCYPAPSIPYPSPVPSLTCIPRPPCLDATPRCLIPEPNGGWCLPTSPTPSVPYPTPPQGCFYEHLCGITQQAICYPGSTNCQPCKTVLVCPSGTPPVPSGIPSGYPNPSCPPVPSCNPRLGILCRLPSSCEPSGTPSAYPTPPHCLPRPTCLSQNPACKLPLPPGGWCPAVTNSPVTNSQSSSDLGNSVLIFFNSFLRGLLGRSQ